MSGYEIFFTLAIIWCGSGIASFFYFYEWIKKEYGSQVPNDNDWILLEFVTAIVFGPLNWLAIAVIVDTHNKDKDNEDDMEV